MRERKGRFATRLQETILKQTEPISTHRPGLKHIEPCEILAVRGPADEDTEEPEDGRQVTGVWLRVRLPSGQEAVVRSESSVAELNMTHGNPANLIGKFCTVVAHGDHMSNLEHSAVARIRDSFSTPGGAAVKSSDLVTAMYSMDGLVGNMPTNAAAIANESWNKKEE